MYKMLAGFQIVLIILSAVAMVNIMIVLDRTGHGIIERHHMIDHVTNHDHHVDNVVSDGDFNASDRDNDSSRNIPAIPNSQHATVPTLDGGASCNVLHIGREWNTSIGVILQPSDFDCSQLNNVILYVLTTPENRVSRDLIRNTWGGSDAWEYVQHPFTIHLVFVIGLLSDGSGYSQEELQQEHLEHNDILQGDFEDDYEILNLKNLFVLSWIKQRCPVANIDFVFKTDDDVYVNIFQLLHHMMESMRRYTPCHFLCNVFKNVAVEREGKWPLTREQYAPDTLHQYCQGVGYAICKQGLTLLFKKLERIREPPLRLEDVYMTSLLPTGGLVGPMAPEIVYHRIVHSLVVQKPQMLDKDNVFKVVMIHGLPQTMWTHLHLLLSRHLADSSSLGMRTQRNKVIKLVKTSARLRESQ